MRQLGTKLESHQTCHNRPRDLSPPEPPQVWPPRSARCRRQFSTWRVGRVPGWAPPHAKGELCGFTGWISAMGLFHRGRVSL